ncbi:hypothetical protein [Sphingomonas sp. 22R3R2A-7]|uniref:hypothetical protein n=1 Tax=Sphingomonas sp. 22R3R2A-7 TaxID=3050230 RepID=UPI002FE0A392
MIAAWSTCLRRGAYVSRMGSGCAVWPEVDHIAARPMAQHRPVASLLDQGPIDRVVSSLSSAVSRHSWIRRFIESLREPELTQIGFHIVYSGLVGRVAKPNQPDAWRD